MVSDEKHGIETNASWSSPPQPKAKCVTVSAHGPQPASSGRQGRRNKLGSLGVAYERLVASVIRPPRVEYQVEDLDPSLRRVGGRLVERKDYHIVNERNERLECSRWTLTRAKPRAIIVYLHSNSSCRLAVVRSPVLETAIKASCALVAFDFSGCGRSQGKYVTLGVKEKEDVASVVSNALKNDPELPIVLWGRSMGAVSALLYAQNSPDKRVVALVLDSPFSSMRQLVADVAHRAMPRIPRCCVGCISWQLGRSTKKRTLCDVFSVDAIKAAKAATRPALFIAADRDALAPPETHATLLAKQYNAKAALRRFDGEHNSPRPKAIYDAVLAFISQVLDESSSSASSTRLHEPDHSVETTWLNSKQHRREATT